MKFKGTLIVVKDCNKALKYYHDIFGFQLLRDNDGNMELSGNLYLQEEKYWERITGRRAEQQSNQTELYFEEPEIDSFVKKAGKALSWHGIRQSADDAQLGTAGRQIL